MLYYDKITSLSPEKVPTSSRFLFPHGVCQIDDTYEMTEIQRLVLKGSYPNTVVYLTDPGMFTHSSIDLSSQTGDKITCDFGNICTYEISIIVKDLSAVPSDTCSEEISYNKCVEEQTKDIFHEVRKLCCNLKMFCIPESFNTSTSH